MKRLLWALPLFLLMAFPAEARIEQRQNNDGTADHVGARGTTACVGGAMLETEVWLSYNVLSSRIISPISNAYLRQAWAQRINAVTTGNPSILIYPASQITTPVRFVNPSTVQTATNATLYMDATTASALTARALSTTMQAGGAGTRLDSHAPTEAGQVFTVAVTGAATGIPSAKVMLLVCPR